MKLSEIRGERVFDVIADVIDPIVTIASDKEAAGLFKREKCPEGMEPWQFFLEKVRKSLPTLVKTHKKELVTILAAINDVDEEEYVKELSFPKLLADLIELVNDTEFVSFFA